MIDYSKSDNIEAMLTSVDFKNAFNKMEWNVLHVIPATFNFRQKILQMIMFIYEGIESVVINNGSITILMTKKAAVMCNLSFFLFTSTTN